MNTSKETSSVIQVSDSGTELAKGQGQNLFLKSNHQDLMISEGSVCVCMCVYLCACVHVFIAEISSEGMGEIKF